MVKIVSCQTSIVSQTVIGYNGISLQTRYFMKGRVSMPAQEERLTELEQTMAEYRPVLQSMAYELTMVKGLIVNQVEITRQLKQDMQESKQDMADLKKRLARIEEQLATILTLLKPS